MTTLSDRAMRWYARSVLGRPRLIICLLVIVIGFLGYKARDFRIDASAETLLLEHDQDLRYTREINKRYGVNDFLVIAYRPADGNLLSDTTLKDLKDISAELNQLAPVTSVLSLLNVPLFESPPLTFDQMAKGIPNLESPGIDKDLARKEFKNSPFYRDLIVSEDMTTTALVVNLKTDQVYRDLINERNALHDKQLAGKWTPADEQALESVNDRIAAHTDQYNQIQHRLILDVRAIMDKYRGDADLHLSGISMIADDMISFIKKDLRFFGTGVFFLLVVMLGFIFRRIRWIVMPMLCCFLSVIAMMGVLGAFGWDVTVISSNFISLQLIITLAIVVHLIVRYREYRTADPDKDQMTLINDTVRTKFVPCLYASLTTIAGFGSLLLCDIKPVINFGWMMSAGILMSLLLTFIIFPAGIGLLEKEPMPSGTGRMRFPITTLTARVTEKHGGLIVFLTIVLSVLTLMGVSRLEVENSFIDYFKDSTEIHQGMKIIDRQLGGTTPLDVIVKFKKVDAPPPAKADNAPMDEDPEFAEFMMEEAPAEDYWFLDERMKTIEQVHDYLDGLPETGKVLSFATVMKLARQIRGGKSLDSFEMNVFYQKLPDKYKDLVIAPYINFDANEARFSVRIMDSLKSLRRDALLKRIKHDLVNKLGLEPDRVRLAGAMVLYNNMLQSLFNSQIKTIGVVALALMAMFLVLFRSLTVSLIAMFPNLLSAGAVLAIMGWMGIPLDMMTITIAAISVGIAVDDTIHYIYRFREEIKKDGDYIGAMHRCHESIGHAMYYTSITIIIGFSILALSNFWPTIYFGVFTGLAMLIAIIAALTLLPYLIILFKPFGNPAPHG